MQMISNCTQDAVKKASRALMNGHLVAFPTETVYGLGADAANEKAVSRVYQVKSRPIGHPLIVHVSSPNKIGIWARDIPDYAYKLAENFWPGPMTLILQRKTTAKNFITGAQDSVGLRVPNNRIALALLEGFEDLGGIGVVAPSANRFGCVSPTIAEAVIEELGEHTTEMDMLLDDGLCEIGIESTIINCTNLTPKILRPGMISKEMIESITRKKTENEHKIKSIKFSGSYQKHYAPKAKIKINQATKPFEGFIALAGTSTPYGSIRLISPNSMEEFARHMYLAFRLADSMGIKVISITLPEHGVPEAIKDRLVRASYGS